MTSPELPPLPAIDLSSVTPQDIEGALPMMDAQQQQAWKQAMATVTMLTQSNLAADAQLHAVLATVGSFARSLGLVLTVAKAVA